MLVQNPTGLQCGNEVTGVPASCQRLKRCILAVVIVTGQELDARLLEAIEEEAVAVHLQNVEAWLRRSSMATIRGLEARTYDL